MDAAPQYISASRIRPSADRRRAIEPVLVLLDPPPASRSSNTLTDQGREVVAGQ